MSNYAEAKIEYEDKLVFQTDICKYYARKCKQIYRINGKSYKKQVRESKLTPQVMEQLLKHETNIWACINRMVDVHKPIQQEDLAIDEEQVLKRFSTLKPSFPLHKANTWVEVNDLG